MTPQITEPSLIQLRRIATIARRMEREHGWSRRRAIAFAVEKVRRSPTPPARRTQREMNGETREYLDHRNRSVAKWSSK